MKKIFLILVGMSILALCIILVSATRLPIVGGDSDGWGAILNDYLSKIAGSDATTLNQTMVNGTNIYDSSINTTHLIDGTITDMDISDTINLTIGQKITFNLGGVIDNIVDDWVRIKGGLNVSENLEVAKNFTVGTNTLHVDSDNDKVGIGTASPSGELEIRNDGNHVETIIRRENNTFGASYNIQTGTTHDWIIGERGTGDSNFRIYSYGTASDVFVINRSTGYVGIGTASPGYKLEVNGTITTGPSGDGLTFIEPTASYLARIKAVTAGDAAGSELAFYTHTGATMPEVMRIDDDGNVGIGTTIPAGIFHINKSGASTINWVNFYNNVGTGGGTPPSSMNKGLIFGWNPSAGAGESQILYGISAGSAPRLEFGSWNGTTKSVSMTIKNGNVGIGTPASTAHKLYVEGNGYFEGTGGWDGAGDFGAVYLGSHYSSGVAGLYGEGLVFGVYKDGGGGTLHANSMDAMFIEQTSGNVGIGTTSPDTVISWTSSDTLLNVLDTTNRGILVAQGATGGALLLADTGGAADDKMLRLECDAGIGRFSSILDDGSNFKVQDILTMDLGNGKVGIGIASPNTKLHIQDVNFTSAASLNTHTKVLIEDSDHAYLEFSSSDFQGLIFSDNVTSRAAVYYTHNGDYMRFDSAGIANAMVIKGANVGIGTASPDHLLTAGDLLGSPTNPEGRIAVGNDDGLSGYDMGVDTDNRSWMVWDNDGYFTAGTRESGVTYTDTIVMKTGNVGIGARSPDYTLHVDGRSMFKGIVPNATLHGNKDYDTIFNTFSPLVPNIGDIAMVSGGIEVAPDIMIASYINRTTSTCIVIRGISVAGSPGVVASICDGGSTSRDISLTG